MAISQQEYLTFDYIDDLYTDLNQARTKFDFDTINLDKQQYDTHEANDIINLNSYLLAMKTNKYLKNIDMSSIDNNKNDPTQYETYIIPYYINNIETIIDAIQDTCAHNSHCSHCNDCANYSNCPSYCNDCVNKSIRNVGGALNGKSLQGDCGSYSQ